MYTYFGFGLHIHSELEFPELMPSDEAEADIRIDLGEISDSYTHNRQMDQAFSHWAEHYFLLHIPGVGTYLSEQGNHIIAHLHPNADIRSFRLFLLSNALSAILVQRKQILLHASAVIVKDSLALFMGPSGAGKSSIVAELRKKGYTIFSDDVCVLQPPTAHGGKCLALASYPMMKLWKQTMDTVRDPGNSEAYRIFPDKDKFGQFFHADFATHPIPISTVCILNPVDQPGPYKVRKLEGMDAFQAIAKNTYRSSFIKDKGIQKIHFESIAELARTASVLELTRSVPQSDITGFSEFARAQL